MPNSLTHTRAAVGLQENIALQDPGLFTFFSFQDSFFRLGYESATLLMVMMADSVSCSMHQADMTLPCTAGWVASCSTRVQFTLPYPILSCPLTGTVFLHSLHRYIRVR
jgi:hypothetical protein